MLTYYVNKLETGAVSSIGSRSEGDGETPSSKPAVTVKGEMPEDRWVSSFSAVDKNSMSSVSAGETCKYMIKLELHKNWDHKICEIKVLICPKLEVYKKWDHKIYETKYILCIKGRCKLHALTVRW